MIKLRNTLVGVIAITMASFSSAFSFEGFSLGASYSSLDFNTSGNEVSEGTLGSGPTKNATSKSGSGDIGSLFAEYTFAQGSTIGIEMIQGSTEIGAGSRVEPASTTSGTVKVSAAISDPITFYVEPTYMMSDTFGVYLKGGATSVSVEPKEVSDTGGVVTSTYKAEDVYGIMTGFGAKFYMGNLFVKGEYVETDFETYHHTSTTGDKNSIDADISTEEYKFSVGYNF
jgi:hypothetical protein